MLQSQIIKHELNTDDLIYSINTEIQRIIDDTTGSSKEVEFQIDFKDCSVTIKGKLQWIFNPIPEVVDFIRLNIHTAEIIYEHGDGGRLSLSEIQVLENALKLG